jgi:hypothetical protein
VQLARHSAVNHLYWLFWVSSEVSLFLNREVGRTGRGLVPEEESSYLRLSQVRFWPLAAVVAVFSVVLITGTALFWQSSRESGVPTSDPWLGCKDVQTMASFDLQRCELWCNMAVNDIFDISYCCQTASPVMVCPIQG